MARMPDFESEIARDLHHAGHDVASTLRHLTHPHLFRHDDTTQTPAVTPVNLAAAAAAAPNQEDPMSLASDVEQGYQAVKDEIAKFDASLPGIIGQARKLEGNPLAELAIQAGEHVLAGILPVEALDVIKSGAEASLASLLSLYNPQGQPVAPAPAPAPAAPAPAQ